MVALDLVRPVRAGVVGIRGCPCSEWNRIVEPVVALHRTRHPLRRWCGLVDGALPGNRVAVVLTRMAANLDALIPLQGLAQGLGGGFQFLQIHDLLPL